MANPYHPSASQISRFPFASRTSAAPAPLFYSATDEFREENDGEEHEREVADFYALQRSRRQFGASHLTESTEGEEDIERVSDHSLEGGRLDNNHPGFGTGRGIKSSWRGDKISARRRAPEIEPVQEREDRDKSVPLSEASESSSKGKGKLVDVELGPAMGDSMEELERDEDASDNLLGETDEHPPAFQQFRNPPMFNRPRSPLRTTLPIPQETDEETLLENPRPMSPDRESVPPVVSEDPMAPPRHDFFWAELFIIAKCALVGTFFITLLQTSTPDKKIPLGDTIYTTLHLSFHLLSIYSLVSVIVGLLWLALLRSFVRPLIFLILVSVPTILFSFFLYPFISSYKGT